MIRIAISGVDGSMGGLVAKEVIQDKDIQIVAGFTVPQSPNEGKDIGVFHGCNSIKVPISSSEKLASILQSTKPDVFVDFTIAKAAEKNLIIVADQKVKCIVGTTALSPDFLQKFEKSIKQNAICAVISPNMSLGVNILFKLSEQLTKLLGTYDIEIIEAHHNRKQDVPSGTAMKLAQIIASNLNKNIEDIGKYGRAKGVTPRKIGPDEIGIHAIRAGDIVGDHTILFAGPGERLEITHRAHSRQCFVTGTLAAIKFIAQKGEPGRIYSMQDVLGIS
jgi:4-hydroxy-tetrahydrodipicolinate reductase